MKVPKRVLAKVARETLELMSVAGGTSVTLVLVDNDAIKDLNKRFRGEDSVTDVMAFPGDSDYLGDVIISVEKAKEQAPFFGFSFEKELALLVVHGLLHLLGFRDYSPQESEEMNRTQLSILQKLTIKGIVPSV